MRPVKFDLFPEPFYGLPHSNIDTYKNLINILATFDPHLQENPAELPSFLPAAVQWKVHTMT